jgi:hypothetical protein
MRCADLDDVRNRRLPVVTRQPDSARIYDHSPIPQTNHSRNVSVSAQDDLGVDPFSSSLNSVDRTRAYVAVNGDVVEPKSSVVPRRCVAQEHLFSMHKRGWHACHPIEVLALKLPEIAPSRGTYLPEFNKNSILIAAHRRKAPLNQQVRSSGCLEWAAYMIAEVHDLVNAEGTYVRKYGLAKQPTHTRTESQKIGSGCKTRERKAEGEIIVADPFALFEKFAVQNRDGSAAPSVKLP